MDPLFLRHIDIPPKAVPTRPIRRHGLFAFNFVKQHMMIDERWMPNSTSEQFARLSQLLRKRLQYHNLDKEMTKAKLLKKYRILKYQTRAGRLICKRLLIEDNSMRLRNLLLGHKELQRLYHGMPLDQVLENMNERTFTMRKERDRLIAHLEIVKQKYTKLLMQRSEIENYMTYMSNARQDMHQKEGRFRRLIDDSNTRIAAIKTINCAYKKIIQILRCDAIFYDPILKSLDNDILDQELFIKNIIYLSIPAIQQLRETTIELNSKQDIARKSIQVFRESFSLPNLALKKRMSTFSYRKHSVGESPKKKRFNLYVRETGSMLAIKYRLKTIEDTIKQVKIATLRSQALALYPEIKNQVEHNKHLRKVIESDMLGLEAYAAKQKCAEVVEEYLKNNINEEEVSRTNMIERLKDAIKASDNYQAKILRYIKDRSNLFVLIRYSLWNINDIMKYVASARASIPQYPNAYLKLPLLKFETLHMHAVPPEPFEEDITQLMKIAKDKLKLLLKNFKRQKASRIDLNRDIYQAALRDAMDYDAATIDEPERVKELNYDIEPNKFSSDVPSRKQIKINSAKIVEESLKSLED